MEHVGGVAVGAATGARGLSRREEARATAPAFPLLLLPIVVVGLLVRLAAADRLPPHVDEGNMVLGIHTVAARGWPLLPSGVLYIHGATISYLLAPLAWLGWADYTNLFPLRVASAIFGAVAIYLTYRLARTVLGSSPAALLAAVFVALDPLNVLWGGFIRMYSLLEVLALLIAWVFVRIIARDDGEALPDRPQAWLLAGLVVTFWLAVFTQAVASLLWPVMAVTALLLFGRSLLGAWRSLTLALGLCLLAPLAFLAASTFVGYGSTTDRTAGKNRTGFLGDDALDLSHLLHPSLRGLSDLYAHGPIAGFVPILIVLVCGLVLGRYLLTTTRDDDRVDRRAIGFLLLLFWTPILLFAFFVAEQKSRYLLDILPIGYILVAAAVMALISYRDSHGPVGRPSWLARLGAVGLVLLLFGHFAGGLWTLNAWGIEQTEAGLPLALNYVVAHRAAGELTVVGSTPEAYLVLGNQEPVQAYGGVLARPGSGRGSPKIDDWVGWPVVQSTRDLCAVLTAHPGTWFVLGNQRLDPGVATTTFLLGATKEVLQTPDGFHVFRSTPSSSWDPAVAAQCGK
jgi:hypothetical protein